MYNEDARWQRALTLVISCHYLCVEGAARVAEVVRATEDKPREDLFLLDAFKPQLQVLPRSRVVCLHIVAQQAQDLHRVLQHSDLYIIYTNTFLLC